MEYRFQVNLGGIIDLLSNHTYSSPEVYIRELLQNGADAIVARKQIDPDYGGSMNISVTTSETGTDHFLIFSDDGS